MRVATLSIARDGLLERLAHMLGQLRKHRAAGPFLQPVDPAVWPGYSVLVPQPICLADVRRSGPGEGVLGRGAWSEGRLEREYHSLFIFNRKFYFILCFISLLGAGGLAVVVARVPHPVYF